MLNLFYKNKLIMKGYLADLLGMLHQFNNAELTTHDKVNYILILH